MTTKATDADSRDYLTQECSSCYYWVPVCYEDPHGISDAVGACRRHPPVINLGRGIIPELPGSRGVWPETFPSSWCGEWKRRPGVDG